MSLLLLLDFFLFVFVILVYIRGTPMTTNDTSEGEDVGCTAKAGEQKKAEEHHTSPAA